MRRFKVWIWTERTSISLHSTLFRETIGHLHILPQYPFIVAFLNVAEPFFKISPGYREKKSDVTLLWQQNFWITTGGSLSNDDGNENGKKSKTTTLHVHHAFLYISQPSLHVCDIKLPNFTRPLYGVGEQNITFSFSFSKFGQALSDSTPETFVNI